MGFELLDGSQRSSTCDRVAAIGSSKGTWDGAIHNFSAASHTRKRHTSCNAFSGSNQIRNNLLIFGGKPLACASKPRLNFISNEYNIIIPAPLRNRRHEALSWYVNAIYAW